MTTTQVIYARVPAELKEAADAYAAERAETLTSAVVDLVGRGLAAATDEASVGELRDRVARLTSERAEIEADLRSARAELGTLQALTQRTRQAVGTCPNASCRGQVTGYDLLAAGLCPSCGKALPDLLAFASGVDTTGSASIANVNERDILLLLGAVGAVVGVAYLATRGGT